MPDSTPLAPRDPNRRRLIGGLAALPLAPSLAAVLADPKLAAAQAAETMMISIATKDGREVSGAFAAPEQTPAPAVLLIHEWWGLNDQIKAMAAEFAGAGYLALAVDLYGGEVAADADEARALMSAVEEARATETLEAWVGWLRDHGDSTGKVGVVGWCFGGGWALNTALAAPVDATVVYYGRVNKTAEQLESLDSPVLGHFATQDNFINQEMVEGFEQAMEAAGKDYTTHWYEADHAFANPTGARYDQADAAEAWQRTKAFLAEHLKE